MPKNYPDTEWLRARVVEEIFYKPVNFLLPMFVGLPLAIGPWALGQASPLITFSGVLTCLLSLGAYATKVSLNWGDEERLRQRVLDRHARETEKALREKLERLRRDLVADGDQRSEKLFDQLISLQETLRSQAESGLTGVDQAEIFARVEELVEASLTHLEDSAQLMAKAGKASTQNIKSHLLEQREQLLEETRKSIEALDRILAAFLANQKQETSSETARIREELELQLEISERVKEQLESLDRPRRVESFDPNPNPNNLNSQP
jgi:hypothetical protein